MINVVLNPKTPRVRILGKNGFKLCSSSAQEWWGGTSVQGWAVIERPRMGDGFGWTSIFSSSVQGCTEQIYYEKRKNFSSSAQEWGGDGFVSRQNAVYWAKTKITPNPGRSRVKISKVMHIYYF